MDDSTALASVIRIRVSGSAPDLVETDEWGICTDALREEPTKLWGYFSTLTPQGSYMLSLSWLSLTVGVLGVYVTTDKGRW